MAKRFNNDDNDNRPIDSGQAGEATYQKLQKIATIQRSLSIKLQDQGARIGHLLGMLNVATGSQVALQSGARSIRRNAFPPDEQWKNTGSTNDPKYDGGADAALDTLIAGISMRMLKIVEDDNEWSTAQADKLHQSLEEWATYEKLRTSMAVNAEAAQRRPSVLHTVELFNGPRDLWYAVMVPFTQCLNDNAPVIGVGETPVDAAFDFDRCFKDGQLNPAAALFLEEIRKEEESKRPAKRKTSCQRKSGPRKK